MGLIILYFLGALSLSFLCSVLEAVLLSTPMSFISMKENQGSKTASLMKQYKNNVDRPVGAILSLNTIAHTIGSAGVSKASFLMEAEPVQVALSKFRAAQRPMSETTHGTEPP